MTADLMLEIRFMLVLLGTVVFYAAAKPVHPSQIELHGNAYKETDARLYTFAVFLFGLAVIL